MALERRPSQMTDPAAPQLDHNEERGDKFSAHNEEEPENEGGAKPDLA